MFGKITLFIFLALEISINCTNGANILYLNAIASPSHHIWNSAIVNALAAKGHNVTYLTPSDDKFPQKDVHYILINELYNDEYYALVNDFIAEEDEGPSPLSAPNYFTEFMLSACKDIVKTKGVRKLMEYPDDFHFDLVIHDMTVGSCALGLLHKFKYPPLLSVTAFSYPPYLNEFVGGHHYYSYVPHYALPHSTDMCFFDRIYNFIIHIVEKINWKYSYIPRMDEIMKEFYGSDIPSVRDLEQRTAIALMSTTSVFDQTQPITENVIAVGGLHIRDPKPLPKDIEDIIVSSKKGAVLFSLGSNFPSSALTVEKRKIIVDAFEQLPDYHFLWKYEKPMTDLKLPKNVFIQPWLPQPDILNHTNTKAFITHSGLLSTLESIWRGVPMIGMPFGFDQVANIAKSKARGVGEKLEFRTLSTKDVVDTLRKVLEDPTYHKNAKKLSAQFRDQKEKPIERAVWWAEWLIRNPDCEYLKSPVLRLGFIVGNSFDVIATVSIALFVIVLVLVKFSFCLMKLFFGSSKSNAGPVSNKQNKKKQN